jgi:hypothetical protein
MMLTEVISVEICTISEGISPFIGKWRGIIVIKRILVSAVGEKISPHSIIEIWWLVGIAGDGRKPIIMNTMILGGDVVRQKIENKRHSGGMLLANSKIHSAARSSLPTGKFVAVL